MAATAPPPGAVELRTALANTMVPDNTVLHAAETWIKAFWLKAASPAAFFYVIENDPDEAVRQQAAVLVRLRITIYMTKFDVAGMNSVKELLLRRMLAEPSRPTRLAVCALTAAVAKSRLASWPELLTFVGVQARGAEEGRREMALLLLSAVLEAASGTMIAFLPSAVPLIGAGLCDSGGTVQIQALRCCSQALQLLPYDSDLTQFEPLVPPMMSVVHKCLSGRHEDLAGDAFEALHDVIVAHPRLLLAHMNPLCTMLISVVTSDAMTDTTRDSASMLLMDIIGARPTAFAASGMLTPLLTSLIRCASEPTDDPVKALRDVLLAKDHDATGATSATAASMGVSASRMVQPGAEMIMPGTGMDSGDEVSVTEMACRVLGHLALHMPGKAYFDQVMAASEACVVSPDWNVRFVGLMLLRNSVEGLRTHFRANLPRVLGVVTKPFMGTPLEPSAAVVVASLFTLADIAQRLSQFLAPHVRVMLPSLMAKLSDPEIVVVDMASFALETLLDDDTSAVLDGIEGHMMAAAGKLIASTSVALRLRGLALLGSVAISMGGGFHRFLEPAMRVLLPLMSETAAGSLEMRANATETIGSIAQAVGKEAFLPILHATDLPTRLSENFAIARAIAAAASNPSSPFAHADPALVDKLHVCSFAFFSNMTPVLQADVLTLMPALLTAVGAALSPADCVVRQGSAKVGLGSEALEAAMGIPESMMADSTMVDEFADAEAPAPQVEDVHSGTTTTFVEVSDVTARAEAMNLLGTLLATLGEAMAPHLATSMQLCLENLAFYEEAVREKAALALAYGCRCQARCEMAAGTATVAPQPNPAGCRALLSPPKHAIGPKTSAVLDESIAVLISMAASDPEPEVAGAAIQALNITLRDFGAAPMAKHLNRLLELVVNALLEKLKSQYPEEEGDLEDDGNLSHFVFEETYDLLGTLCARGGPALWEAGLAKLWPVFVSFAGKSRHPSQQCGVVGCLGEITDGLGECPGFVSTACGTILPVLGAAVASDDPMLSRNGLYTAGALLENKDACIVPLLPSIMPALIRACRRDADSPHATVDNAISATCRALNAHAATVDVPGAVAAIVAGLPLREDQAENPRVWSTLLDLAEAGEATMLAAAAQVIRAAASEIEATPGPGAASKALMLRCIVSIGKRNGAAAGAAISAMQPSLAASINERIAAVLGGSDIVAAASSPTKAAAAAAAAAAGGSPGGSPGGVASPVGSYGGSPAAATSS